MKILLTAFALTFALPAAAQTATTPPAQPHAQGEHAQHGQAGGHGEHHGQHQGQHQGGQGHGQHAQGCCADRDGNGRMDCCERMQSGEQGGHSGHDAPAGQPQAPQGH